MNLEQALNLLKGGPSGIQDWNARPDMIDLIGIDLSWQNLESVNLSTADLTNSNFSGSILRNADLTDANLSGANLSGADLTDARLNRASLELSTLNGAKLLRAELVGAQLTQAKANSVNLRYARLVDGVLGGVILAEADLTGADLTRCQLQHADLKNATLKIAKLADASLQNSDLECANLTKANFRNAKFNGANLAWVTLRDASMQLADISDCDVNGALLHRTKGMVGGDRVLDQGLRNGANVRFSYLIDVMPWSRIRAFGKLPLFGVSYTGIVSIWLFSICLRFYNDFVRIHGLKYIQHLYPTEQLPPRLVADPYMKWTLMAFSLLAVGATTYKVTCPAIVQESSLTRWVHELDKPRIEYQCLAYSRLSFRLVAAFSYLAGGVWLFWLLIRRVIDAFVVLSLT